MENESQPRPAEEAEQTLSEAIWFISKWAVGGILQLLVLGGTMFLSMLVFILLMRNGANWLVTLASTAAVFAAGMSGMTWAKTQWIIHVMPEVLQDFVQKNK